MRVFLVQKEYNLELLSILNKKYVVENNIYKLKGCKAVIVSNVENITSALNVIDYALYLGIEIICVMPSIYKYKYVANILKRDGCIVI